MDLTTFWFAAVAFFWVGYLVLEGFDFGIGMLSPVLGRDVRERGAVLGTIGPVWDGNEVWIVVAIGATFAAFPLWYATMLSAFYLPMLAILVALIGRGVALEFRGKRDDERWQRGCDVVVAAGSALPALLWGAVLGTLVHGLPVDDRGVHVGSLAVVDGVAGLVGALALAGLCVLHGAAFAALRTTGVLRRRAFVVGRRVGPAVLFAAAAFLVQVQYARGDLASGVTSALAVVAVAFAVIAMWRVRDGLAFAGTAAGMALTVLTVFLALFPDVVPSTLDPSWTTTVADAAAEPYALRTMTVIALVFAPLVLAYQAWSYWVFRRRVVAP